ncbi:MAG TPA: hypothetical protein DCP31_06250 [Cyanobacteria bacterium UBA8543]|nr:hypothetical protein [Cyanobacteria bacterium UBA8543]
MPLICLEGPSAVGKTTTGKALAEQYTAYVVPEVNQLFERPTPEPTYWYFERQVERWALAQEKLETHEVVVLDGDVFQPLWYNWSFNFVDWQPLSVMRDFYRQHLVNQTIGFPDGYILLSTNESELLQRKVNDPTRTRSGFTKNLQVIEPQKRYFQAMNSKIPGLVQVIESTNIEHNIQKINQVLPSFLKLPKHSYSLIIFDLLIEWLYTNRLSST